MGLNFKVKLSNTKIENAAGKLEERCWHQNQMMVTGSSELLDKSIDVDSPVVGYQ